MALRDESTREPFWRRMASATMAALAILLLATSLWRQRMANEQVLYMQAAADQWAYYNSKAALADQYRLFSDLLAPEDSHRQIYQQNFEKYDQQKAQIQEEAQQSEAASGGLAQQLRSFSFAEAALEFSIVVCFLAIFTGRSPFWYTAILGAAAGVALVCLAFV